MLGSAATGMGFFRHAWAIARNLGASTVIADLDIAFGTAGLDFNQDPPQGVADAVFAPERLDANMLDRLLSRLDKGEGSAGKLLHDAELYDNLSAALKELRQLVADVRQDPKRYLRVKVTLF